MSRLTYHPALKPFSERYADLPMRPIRIVLRLLQGVPMAVYDPIGIDSLLARAVVNEATDNAGLANVPLPYDLPVPLHCLWRDAHWGLPLWAATPLMPSGRAVKDVVYWHRRAQPGTLSGTKSGTLNIMTTGGRWLEVRRPMPTEIADEWVAEAVGNPDEVARLLGGITHVGKHRATGFGAVRDWHVEALDAFSLTRDGVLTRPLPEEALPALLPGSTIEDAPAPVPWTSPYWGRAMMLPGWVTGTAVSRTMTSTGR